MEQQLKQRLIGAAVLVSLAVIFIPVILEGPDDEWVPRTHDIPAPPELDYRASMDLPLPEPDTQETPVSVTTPVAPAAPQPEQLPIAENTVAVNPVPPESPQVAAPDSGQPVQAVPPQRDKTAPGWYAQVGSFSKESNAVSVRDGVVKAGYQAQLQTVDTGKGSSYRVLVGPEKSRASAEQLLRKLDTQLNRTGIVIEVGASGE
jgi:DedD protein